MSIFLATTSYMSENNYSGAEAKDPPRAHTIPLVPRHETTKVEDPGKDALDLPSSGRASQCSSVMCSFSLSSPIRGHPFNSTSGLHPAIQSVAIVGLLSDRSFGTLLHDSGFQNRLHPCHFWSQSASCTNCARKTTVVCNCHDLAALARFRFHDHTPTFVAGANVPGTKHSLRSRPASSRRWSPSTRQTPSIVADSTPSWNRRSSVCYAPYRAGISFHGALVPNTHTIASKPARRFDHARPRPSRRTGPAGNMAFTSSHWCSVTLIHDFC
jgi:hypothetical protein